jgi:hypothetical protein
VEQTDFEVVTAVEVSRVERVDAADEQLAVSCTQASACAWNLSQRRT